MKLLCEKNNILSPSGESKSRGAHLVRDFIEYRYHIPHVVGRENRNKELPLAAMEGA